MLGVGDTPKRHLSYAYKRETSKTNLVDKPKEYKQSTSQIFCNDLKESEGLQYALLRVLGQCIYKPNLFLNNLLKYLNFYIISMMTAWCTA